MDSHRTSGNSLMTDGIISLLAGLILLFLTGISQSAIVFVFSAYAVILGIAQIVAARGEREPGQSTAYLTVLGAYSIVAGIILLFFMTAPLTTVITLIAYYVIITGLAEAYIAYAYRSEIGGYAWSIGTGVVRILFGLYLLFTTGMALPALILSIAVYAILVGIAMTVFGYEVRAQVGKYHQRPMTQ